MSIDAAWYVDPLQRFSGRMFDGVQWTDQVSHDGRLRTDPDWPPTPSVVDEEPSVPGARRGMLVPERRDTGERRQINVRRDNLDERRKGDRRKS